MNDNRLLQRDRMTLGFLIAILFSCAAAPTLSAQEAETTLDDLKDRKATIDEAYAESVKTEREALLNAFDQAIDAAADKGALEEVEQLQSERKNFVSQGGSPKSLTLMLNWRKYSANIAKAKATLTSEYSNLVKEATKARQFAFARQVKDQTDPVEPHQGAGQPSQHLDRKLLDVSKQIDVAQHVAWGKWQKRGSILSVTMDGKGTGWCKVPVVPTQNYKLKFRYLPRSGRAITAIYIPLNINAKNSNGEHRKLTWGMALVLGAINGQYVLLDYDSPTKIGLYNQTWRDYQRDDLKDHPHSARQRLLIGEAAQIQVNCSFDAKQLGGEILVFVNGRKTLRYPFRLKDLDFSEPGRKLGARKIDVEYPALMVLNDTGRSTVSFARIEYQSTQAPPKINAAKPIVNAKNGQKQAHLCDLPYEIVAQNPKWMFTTPGYSMGRTVPISFRNTKYSKGIGLHPSDNAPAEMRFSVDKKFDTLRGAVAINDSCQKYGKPRTSLTFVVMGDGKQLWKSKPIDYPNSQSFDVPITGVKELTLKVECPGSAHAAQAIWLDPIMAVGEKNPAGKTRLIDKDNQLNADQHTNAARIKVVGIQATLFNPQRDQFNVSKEGIGVYPDWLKGAIVYPSVKGNSPKNEFTVLKSGTVFLSCHYGYEGGSSGGWKEEVTPKDQLIRDGWVEIDQIKHENGRQSNIFRKEVKAGETYRIRCNKYSSPVPIIAKDARAYEKP